MDEDLLASLLGQIDDLRGQMDAKDQEISRLKGHIDVLRRRGEASNEDSKQQELGRAVSEQFGYKSANMAIFGKMIGNVARIEFPKTSNTLELPPMPELGRDLSIRSVIATILSSIKPLEAVMKTHEEQRDIELSVMKDDYDLACQRAREKFSNETAELKSQIETLYSKVAEEYSGRMIVDHQMTYMLESVDSVTQDVKLTQLSDRNGIPLAEGNSKVKSMKVQDLGGVALMSDFEVDQFLTGANRFIIQYQIFEEQCLPFNILPPGLSLQDYAINFNKASQTIESVSHNQDGNVKFEGQIIDQDVGYVAHSVIEVFTNEVSPNVLNLMHIHLEDMSEEIPIEIVYILPDQTWQDYKDFSTDHLGRELRYKIIVRDSMINAILLNTGAGIEEVFFIEKRYKEGEVVKLRNGDLARVQSCPTGMLGRDWQGLKQEIEPVMCLHEKQGICKERSLEDLPGYVDLQLIMENGELVKDGTRLAICVCQFEPAPHEDLAILDSIAQKEEDDKRNQANTAVDELTELISQFNKNTLPDKKAARDRLNELSEMLRAQRDEKPEYDPLIAQAVKAIRALTMDLRFG